MVMAPFNHEIFLNSSLPWYACPLPARPAQLLSSLNEDDHHHQPNESSGMFPAVEEANFCSNFQCCGKSLKDLHELLQHYEESHVKIEESEEEDAASGAPIDFDTVLSADSLGGRDAGEAVRRVPGGVLPVPSRSRSVADASLVAPAASSGKARGAATRAKAKRARVMTLGVEPCDFAEGDYDCLSAFDNTVIRCVELNSVNSGRHGFTRIAPKRAHSVPSLPNFPLMNSEGGYQLIHTILSATVDPPTMPQDAPAPSSSSSLSASSAGSASASFNYGTRGSSDRPFVCPIPGCGKTYKNANGLKYHALHGHDGDFVEKPHKCPFSGCGKRYKNSNGLKYHFQHSHQHPAPSGGSADKPANQGKASCPPPEGAAGPAAAVAERPAAQTPMAVIASLIKRNPMMKHQIPAILKNLQQIAIQKAASKSMSFSVGSSSGGRIGTDGGEERGGNL